MKTLSTLIALAALSGFTLADESKPKPPAGALVGAAIGQIVPAQEAAADEKPEAPAGAVGGGAVGQVIQEQNEKARQKEMEGTLKKLEGTEWRLERIGGKESAKGVTSTIGFKADGTVSGRAAVNRFSGAFKMEDGKLKTGPFITTRMAGSPEAMKQEAAFVAALSAVQSLTLVDGKLVIKSGCGCGCGGDCKDGCKTCGPECGCKGKCPPATELEFMSADKGHPLE